MSIPYFDSSVIVSEAMYEIILMGLFRSVKRYVNQDDYMLISTAILKLKVYVYCAQIFGMFAMACVHRIKAGKLESTSVLLRRGFESSTAPSITFLGEALMSPGSYGPCTLRSPHPDHPTPWEGHHQTGAWLCRGRYHDRRGHIDRQYLGSLC